MLDAKLTIVRLRVAMPAAGVARERLQWPATGRAHSDARRLALGFAPDQWLLVSNEQSADQLIADCAHALVGHSHLGVDVSAGMFRFTLEGPSTRTLLSMGSGVDWRRRSTPPGSSLRLRFAKIAAIVHVREWDTVDLYIDTSYRDYLRVWVDQARRDPLVSALESTNTESVSSSQYG